MKKRIMKLALVVLCLFASLLPITARKEVSDVGLKGDAKVYILWNTQVERSFMRSMRINVCIRQV